MVFSRTNNILNFILCILGVIFLSSVCQAEEDKSLNPLYIKLGHGVNIISTTKVDNQGFIGDIRLQHKFPSIELGIGRQLDDSIRAEVIFTYYYLFYLKELSRNQEQDIFKVTYKSKIDNLMLNGYKDIFTVDRLTAFVGGGIGFSSIKDKGKGEVVYKEKYGPTKLESARSHLAHRFAYKLSGGIDIYLYDNVHAELAYSYLDLGYNKPKKVDGRYSMNKRKYQLHNIALNIRLYF